MGKKESLIIGRFNTVLYDIVLPMGLAIQRVDLDGTGLELKRAPLEPVLPIPAQMRVSVTQEALCAFLNKKSPGGLKDFSVVIQDERLSISASKVVLFEVRASAICRLEIRDESKLYVVLDKVEVLGVGAKSLIQSQLDAINPVLDMEDFPVRGTLSKVTLEEGMLLLYGKLAP